MQTRVWGRGSSLNELQLDADQSSSTNNALTYSSVTQVDLGITASQVPSYIITIFTNLNAQKMCYLFELKTVAANKGDIKSALAMPFRF